ncbi:hypothetical protein F4819DRAFT_474560 [Hypoxylon fuscum]|nr:hypothetical protein F4819DRAFT_474560 [Hypoxylon fuscum]
MNFPSLSPLNNLENVTSTLSIPSVMIVSFLTSFPSTTQLKNWALASGISCARSSITKSSIHIYCFPISMIFLISSLFRWHVVLANSAAEHESTILGSPRKCRLVDNDNFCPS